MSELEAFTQILNHLAAIAGEARGAAVRPLAGLGDGNLTLREHAARDEGIHLHTPAAMKHEGMEDLRARVDQAAAALPGIEAAILPRGGGHVVRLSHRASAKTAHEAVIELGKLVLRLYEAVMRTGRFRRIPAGLRAGEEKPDAGGDAAELAAAAWAARSAAAWGELELQFVELDDIWVSPDECVRRLELLPRWGLFLRRVEEIRFGLLDLEAMIHRERAMIDGNQGEGEGEGESEGESEGDEQPGRRAARVTVAEIAAIVKLQWAEGEEEGEPRELTEEEDRFVNGTRGGKLMYQRMMNMMILYRGGCDSQAEMCMVLASRKVEYRGKLVPLRCDAATVCRYADALDFERPERKFPR